VKIVDLNVLLYAVNREAVHHDRALRWWESALADEDEPIGLPWVVVLGFLRLATSARVFPSPLTATVATGIVDAWLFEPNIRIVRERDDHWPALHALLSELGTSANTTTDAHLAVLALTHGAVLVSFDNDFARFPRLRWENPLRDRPAH
jgi:toxin-antitoxin system PIN domain toxin